MFKKVWKKYRPLRQFTAAFDDNDDDTTHRPPQSFNGLVDLDETMSPREDFPSESAADSLRRRRARRVIDSDDDEPISTPSRRPNTTSTTPSIERSASRTTRGTSYMSVEERPIMPQRTTSLTTQELFAAHKSVEVIDLTSGESYSTATQSGRISSSQSSEQSTRLSTPSVKITESKANKSRQSSTTQSLQSSIRSPSLDPILRRAQTSASRATPAIPFPIRKRPAPGNTDDDSDDDFVLSEGKLTPASEGAKRMKHKS
jgi:trimeric autotransporter adhesin